jgi:translocation and assembly module TamA
MIHGISLLILIVLMGLHTPAAFGQVKADITITGIEGSLLEQATTNITVANSLASASTPRSLNRRVRQAVTQIENAMKANGYYSAVITPHIEDDEGQRTFRFHVDKGDPVKVGTVQLEISGDGAEFDAFKKWQSDFPLKTGDILVDKYYEDAITDLQRTARNNGFFDGKISSRQINIDLKAQQADILIHYQTGTRFRYGEIRIEEDYFYPEFLLRFFNIAQGDPFNNDDLQTLHRHFSATDYFASIQVTPVLDQRANGEVPVAIVLQRRKRDRYSAGIGYSTDLGVRGRLGVERRFVNKYGHSADASLDYSELKRQVRINYNVPLSQPYAEKMVLSYLFSDRRDEDLKSRVNGIDASRVWRHGLNNWQYGLWLFTADNELDGEFTEGTFLAPTAGWSYARGDNLLFPRRAWQLGIRLVGASDSVVSSESFLQAELNTTLILPLFERDRLLLRGRLGRTVIDNFSVLPKQLRFYAGGDNSVRGYEYQSLAPRNDNGSLTGGDALVFGSAEYEHYFTPIIGAAVFWDAGTAFFADEAFQVAHGAGVGLHLNLPFGVFRLDVANALSKPDRPWRLHITLRPDL